MCKTHSNSYVSSLTSDGNRTSLIVSIVKLQAINRSYTRSYVYNNRRAWIASGRHSKLRSDAFSHSHNR